MMKDLDSLILPSYHHDHPSVKNVNTIISDRQSLGDRVADAVASTVGSWRFIIVQSCILVAWLVVNVTAWIRHWDPYPFILLNLVLSFQAAYTAPVIMMSQNRQDAKDRVRAEHDYEINLKAEKEIAVVLDRLEVQHRAMLEILDRLDELRRSGLLGQGDGGDQDGDGRRHG
jgi:uncharacterized membrane protein